MKAITATAGALALAATLTMASTANAHPGGYHAHKSSGWYAISACSKHYGAAKHASHKFGGYVIHTSNPKYPNFRNGWYCAVRGAFNKHRAKHVRNKMRYHGAYSAYIKRAY